MRFDPELKYCLKCEGEYRAEIETCAVCGKPLITGASMLAHLGNTRQSMTQRKGALTAEDQTVVVQRGRLLDLKKIEKTLSRENIGVLIAGDEQSCGKGCCPTTFNLMVRMEDAPDAMKLIEDEFNRTTAFEDHEVGSHIDAVFNPDAALTVCPACGFTFAPTTTTCPDCGLCFG